MSFLEWNILVSYHQFTQLLSGVLNNRAKKYEGLNTMILQMLWLLYVASIIIVKNKIYINGELCFLLFFFFFLIFQDEHFVCAK